MQFPAALSLANGNNTEPYKSSKHVPSSSLMARSCSLLPPNGWMRTVGRTIIFNSIPKPTITAALPQQRPPIHVSNKALQVGLPGEWAGSLLALLP